LPKPGETIIGTRFEKSHGGKGANQCVTAAKLGGATALIASVGIYFLGKINFSANTMLHVTYMLLVISYSTM